MEANELLNKYGLPSEKRYGKKEILDIVNMELSEQRLKFMSMLRKELIEMNTSSSVLYNHNWWNEKDMDEFLRYLDSKFALSKQSEVKK